MISKFFTGLGALLSISYILWYIYERFTCLQCFGNDIFFAIPSMVIIPAALEQLEFFKYLVVFLNAGIIFLVFYGVGKLFQMIIKK